MVLGMTSSVSGDATKGFMTKIRDSISSKTIMIIIAILVLLLVAGYYYFNYISPRFVKKDDEYDDEDLEGDAELILFHVDWCPHCKTAKPEWDQVAEEYNGEIVNGYEVQFTEVNCTDETPEVKDMIERYNIEGYPTIKLVKGDQVIDFEAKPTKDTITQFLNTVL